MKMVRLSEIFYIDYGNSFDLTHLEQCSDDCENCVNYVSRTRENNGISARVKKLDGTLPFDAGLITVAGSGNSVLESFIQPSPFYTGFHVFVLTPKKQMSDLEKLFFCHCIRQNRYRYSFGRQANKTLKDILVPEKISPEFEKITLDNIISVSKEAISNKRLELRTGEWKYFKLASPNLFRITGSKTTPLLELEGYGPGKYPYVTTQATNNGVAGFYDFFTETGNILVVDSAVLGYCSYQPLNFSASDHVEKLIPKFKMNQYIGMFLATILNLEQYRYSYGRKACQSRLKVTSISLPAKGSEPDWQLMENYIKSLPYSSNLES
jgi:hypothetical protein